MTRLFPDRNVPLLIVVVSSVYFATVSGVTSSNDGSHYALLRAMVDEGRFEISTYAQFAEGNDLARVNGRVYSDRPPGAALLSVPFYWIGKQLPAIGAALPSRYDAENPALLWALLLPVLAGTGAVVLFYTLLRRWGVAAHAAALAALALAFGTIHWKYSTVLFSHAPSALLILLAVWIALRAGARGRLRTLHAVGLGFVLGLSVLVEYSNAIFAAAVVVYLLFPAARRGLGDWGIWFSSQHPPIPKSPPQHFDADLPPSTREIARLKSLWRPTAGLLLGALIPTGFLFFYNTVNFGAPFTTSYAFAVNYPWAARFSTTFDFPLLPGLQAMLFFSADERFGGRFNQGIFLLSPIALLALLSLGRFWRGIERKREVVFVVGLALIYLLLFSKHRTLHGFTGDGRYFAPFLPLLLLPLGVWAQRHVRDGRRDVRAALSQLLFFGLLFLSVRNIAVHIAFSFNYDFAPALALPLSVAPENLAAFLGTLFPNWRNLPLLWGLEAVVLAVGSGMARWRARQRHG